MKRIFLSLLLATTIAPVMNASDALTDAQTGTIALGFFAAPLALYLGAEYGPKAAKKIGETITKYSGYIGFCAATLASIYCMSKGIEKVSSPEEGKLFMRVAGATGGALLVGFSPLILCVHAMTK